MQAFTSLDAVAAPIARPNVDTDQIVPARFLRKPRKDGYGNYLFHDLRLDKDGRERPDFVLNKAGYRDAKILVAERNFGCGSSREHAVYALWDYGVRAVIAPSFGDIFFGNSFMNGLLLIVLPPADVAALIHALEAKPGRMKVDLAAQTVTGADGTTYRFDIDAYRKRCLLEGLDELGFTLSRRDAIAAFEGKHAAEMPWV